MPPDDPSESFKVTDRRRQAQEEPPRVDAVPEPSAEPERTAPFQPAAGDSPRDLTPLFVMLASSALIALGESADPASGQVNRDLAQAREVIDLLGVLRSKTEGHRTPDEDQLLGHIIYDLQMRFVRATGAPSGRPDVRP
jgi:hypothetical protein